LEIGETFTLAITEDREVYSWGLNDFNQCGRYGPAGTFSLGAGSIKNLSTNNPRFIGAGKDHAVMVDDFNNVFSWGRNMDGQLGLEHARSTDCINVLNNLKDPITNLAVKDNMTFLLTKSGAVIRMPCLKDNSSKYSPQKLNLPLNMSISNISLGSGFGILQATSGLLFALGRNDYGQLGIGSTIEAKNPVLIQSLKEKNEKIIGIYIWFY
jgi:alpha-tubulin suppressor-like RCC1 family protein